MTLTGRLQKYQSCHQVKLILIEYLTGEEILPYNQKQIIEQAKFTYSPSLKAFKEQAKEHVKAIKNENISDKTNELKQIEGIFPQNVSNNLFGN